MYGSYLELRRLYPEKEPRYLSAEESDPSFPARFLKMLRRDTELVGPLYPRGLHM